MSDKDVLSFKMFSKVSLKIILSFNDIIFWCSGKNDPFTY